MTDFITKFIFLRFFKFMAIDMAFIEWAEEYSVRNEVIDEEHKKLIILINALYEAIKIGKGNDYVGKILLKLIDYTKIHFAHEEELMTKYHYPLLFKQKTEHKILTQQVADLYIDFLTGKKIPSKELFTFLRNWLIDHIFNFDKELGDFLYEKYNRN